MYFSITAYVKMGVSKNRGKTPKMDGENNGKPYEQMDDLEVPLIFGNTQIDSLFFGAFGFVLLPNPSSRVRLWERSGEWRMT